MHSFAFAVFRLDGPDPSFGDLVASKYTHTNPNLDPNGKLLSIWLEKLECHKTKPAKIKAV